MKNFDQYIPTFWLHAIQNGDKIEVADDREEHILSEICDLPTDIMYVVGGDTSYDWESEMEGLIAATDCFKTIVQAAAVQCPFVPSSSMGRSYFVGVAVLFPVLARVVLHLDERHLRPPGDDPDFIYLRHIWSGIYSSTNHKEATPVQISEAIEASAGKDLASIVLDICSIVPFGPSTPLGHLPLLYPRQIAFALFMGCESCCKVLATAGMPTSSTVFCAVGNTAVDWLRKVADYELNSLATEEFATGSEAKLMKTPIKLYRTLVFETPLPHAKVLSHNPQRIEHMTTMLSKLGISFEIVKPLSLDEAQTRLQKLMATTSKRFSISRIKRTEASQMMSFLGMLNTVDRPTMLLEDDIEPYFSVEDTHMLIRSCMQLKDTVCFLEWCNGSNNVCHSTKTRFGSKIVNGIKFRRIDNNATRFYCLAATMYTSAQAAQKFRLQITDALREHGVTQSDIIMNIAKPTVALVGPTFYQDNARFGSCIDTEKCTTKHTMPPCWGFRRSDMASNIRLEFASKQSAQARFRVPFRTPTLSSVAKPTNLTKAEANDEIRADEEMQKNEEPAEKTLTYNRTIVLVCVAAGLGILLLLATMFRTT